MADSFTRGVKQAPLALPAAEQDHVDELFSHSREAIPAHGKVIVVVVGDWCPHCHDMEKNTNYAETTADGTPVRWMNMAYMEAYNKVGNIPGVDYKDHHFEVNGVAIDYIPAVIEVIDGKAVQIARNVGQLTDAGSLERVSTAMDAKVQAQDVARDAANKGCSISTATTCGVDPNAPSATADMMKKLLAQPGLNR